MPPAAVLFDLDGTLVDSERDNVESVALAMREQGVTLDADERQFIIGHSWNEIHARLVARHGIALSMTDLIAAAVKQKRQLLASKGYTALPGAEEAVRRLGRTSALAVVSGASRAEVRDAVAGLGLTSAFRLLLGAEDYSQGKPHPEPYQLAMSRLDVPAEGCLVVEDAEPGILSGRAAGARVVAVRAGNFSGYDLSAAHLVIDTLDELTDDVWDSLVSSA